MHQVICEDIATRTQPAHKNTSKAVNGDLVTTPTTTGQDETDKVPEQKLPIDQCNRFVTQKIRTVVPRIGHVVSVNPSKMSVPETQEAVQTLIAVGPRRMRIAGFITMLMMAAMECHPGNPQALVQPSIRRWQSTHASRTELEMRDG